MPLSRSAFDMAASTRGVKVSEWQTPSDQKIIVFLTKCYDSTIMLNVPRDKPTLAILPIAGRARRVEPSKHNPT